MKTKYFLAMLGLCLVLIGSPSQSAFAQRTHDDDAALRKKNGFRELKNVAPKLPNVLLVGDSICSGYNDEVRKLLAGKANVYAWVTGMNVRRGNIEDTQRAALAAADFDVVHFNIGLHGLGNRIPDDMYEPLLRKYVANYKNYAHGAHLIWGSTTPIWDKTTNILSPDNAKIVKRNAIAAKVMKENGIAVTELYDAVVNKLELGSGIHWSNAGYAIMAKAIAKNIEIALKKPRKNSPGKVSTSNGATATEYDIGSATRTHADLSTGKQKSSAGIREYLDYLATRLTTEHKPVATLAEWKARRERLRKQYMDIIGLEPLPKKTPLNARMVGHAVDLHGCTFQRVVFESRPKVYVAAHLYIPKNVTFPVPAVIHVPGHGRRDAYRAYPRTYAENGFVSIALPMVGEEGKRGAGWGKCGEYGPYKGHFNWYNTGYTATGPSVWDGIRAVDYLLTLEDEDGTKMVDGAKIGMAGLSGGSARTLWTTMADPRITCAVVSCGFTAVKDYDQAVSHTCDVHLFYNFFGLPYGELYSLIAPRALLVQHGTHDRLYPNPKPVADYISAIYQLYGKPKRFDFITYDQGHSYGGGVWDTENSWMDRWLRKGKTSLKQSDVFTTTLTCFPDGEPADMTHTECLFTPPTPQWQVSTKEEFQQFKDTLMRYLREKIIRTAFEEIDAELQTVERDDRATCRMEQKNLKLGNGSLTHKGVFFYQPGKACKTVILLADDTIDKVALTKLYEDNYRDAGINLFCLEITGVGDNPWLSDDHYLLDRFAQLVGHTRTSLQIDDIRAAIQTISTEQAVDPQGIYLWGKGKLAVPVIYCAVVNDTVAGVVLEDAPDHHVGITPVEASKCESALFHILRHADIPQATGLIFPRTVILTGKKLAGFHWTQTLYEQLDAGKHFSGQDQSVKDVLARIKGTSTSK